MLQIRISNVFEDTEAIVSLDVDDPNATAEITFEGDNTLIERCKLFLATATGAFGHLIEDRTSAIDLDYAFKSDEGQTYSPEIIKGKKLIKNYDPGIPEDSFT